MKRSFVLLLLFAACGDPDTPLPDAPPAIEHPIVGTWKIDPFDPSDPIRIDVYEASGRLVRDGDVGTWAIEGGDLTTIIDGALERVPFYLSEDHATLINPAFVPVGTIDGAVGTWHSNYEFSNETFDVMLTLRADGTAEWVEVGRTDVGTWSLVNPSSITANLTSEVLPTTLRLRLIPNVSLGAGLFHREQP